MRKYEEIKEDARNFIQHMNTAVIATAFEYQPFASTVYYLADDNFNIYFSTKRNTIKNINAAFNANIAFVVGTGPKHISIQARGAVKIVIGKEKNEILKKLKLQKKRLGSTEWPTKSMVPFKGRPPVVFKITPSELQFMNLDDTTYPRSLSREYHQVIPSIY